VRDGLCPIDNGHARRCQQQKATAHGYVMQQNLGSSRRPLGQAIEAAVLDATQGLPSIVHKNLEHSRVVVSGSTPVSCASFLVRKRHVHYAFEHDERWAYNDCMMEGADVRRQRVGRHDMAQDSPMAREAGAGWCLLSSILIRPGWYNNCRLVPFLGGPNVHLRLCLSA
jgi:hypothetical protein